MEKYNILGLVQSCTKDEIKAAFYRLAKIHHPDKGGDVKKFVEIKNAYEWLMKYHVQKIEQTKRYDLRGMNVVVNGKPIEWMTVKV